MQKLKFNFGRAENILDRKDNVGRQLFSPFLTIFIQVYFYGIDQKVNAYPYSPFKL